MDEPSWRTLSRGRCFVYTLPCREHDLVKIGFSRDPWVRMRSFHPRFHAFFDLERGALIETDRVQEARAIERHLKAKFKVARDLAPPEVRERAGGKFEWFRGIHAQLVDELHATSVQLAYPIHLPLAHWLREQWVLHIPRLIEWSNREFEQIETWRFNADPVLIAPRERNFRNLLDAWESIGIPLHGHLTQRARVWHSYGFDE